MDKDKNTDEPTGLVIPSDYFERDRKYDNHANKHNFNFGSEYSASLLEKYKSETKFNHDSKIELKKIFLHWNRLMRRNFNIAVVGAESSNRLLMKAKKRLSVYFDQRYHFHGFDNCNIALFKETVLKGKEVDEYLMDLKTQKTKVVIIISSYDSLYRKNPETIDFMWMLYERQPDSIGLIFGLDHLNSGRLLKRAAHKILFFESDFNEPFLKERIENNLTEVPDNLGHTIELKSMQDVYQALQGDCQKIMQFILRYFMENPKITEINFQDLMEYSESKFICRRAAVMRSYLSELLDHKIIERISNDFRKISCPIHIEVIKNFLDSLDNTNL